MPEPSLAVSTPTALPVTQDVFASWPANMMRSPAVSGLDLSCLSESSRDYDWQHKVFRLSTIKQPMYAWSCVCVLCATELVSNPTREQLNKHLHNCPTYSYYNVQLGFDPSMRQTFTRKIFQQHQHHVASTCHLPRVQA